jgi:hypothetical protein
MSMGHRDAAAFPAWSSAIAPLHVGRGRGLVDEDHPLGIEVELRLEPGLPRFHHIRSALLAGVDRPFLRVMP